MQNKGQLFRIQQNTEQLFRINHPTEGFSGENENNQSKPADSVDYHWATSERTGISRSYLLAYDL